VACVIADAGAQWPVAATSQDEAALLHGGRRRS
jgi:hypothetical protein